LPSVWFAARDGVSCALIDKETRFGDNGDMTIMSLGATEKHR